MTAPATVTTVESGNFTSTEPLPVRVSGPPAVVLPKITSSVVSDTESVRAIAFFTLPARLYLNGSPVFSRLIAPARSIVSFVSDAARLNLPVEKSTSPSRAISPTLATVAEARPLICSGSAIAMLRRGTLGVRLTDLMFGNDGTFGVIEIGPDDQLS